MKYKTVDKKVQPVPSYMPDPVGQVFHPIKLPLLPPLPLDPPYLQDFVLTHLELMTLQRALLAMLSMD